MKIRPLGAKLFHANGRKDWRTDRQTDRQTHTHTHTHKDREIDKTKLTGAFFHNLFKVLRNWIKTCFFVKILNPDKLPKTRLFVNITIKEKLA
jgi:hypothetical protein